MKKNIVIFILSFLSINLYAKEVNTMKENKKIKIDIISDVVCPWCAIGYNRLNQAIKELNMKKDVQIVWHPFELNPDMPKDGMDDAKYLMNKYNLDKKQLEETRENITKLGEEVDFKFDYFKNMKKVNTLNAHILLNYAKKFGKQTELKTNLQKAYFNDRKDISNRNILAKELEVIGLDVKEALKLLDKKEEIQKIREEENYWKEQGVYSIPAMIFNDKQGYIGAQSVESYKKILIEIDDK